MPHCHVTTAQLQIKNSTQCCHERFSLHIIRCVVSAQKSEALQDAFSQHAFENQFIHRPVSGLCNPPSPWPETGMHPSALAGIHAVFVACIRQVMQKKLTVFRLNLNGAVLMPSELCTRLCRGLATSPNRTCKRCCVASTQCHTQRKIKSAQHLSLLLRWGVQVHLLGPPIKAPSLTLPKGSLVPDFNLQSAGLDQY